MSTDSNQHVPCNTNDLGSGPEVGMYEGIINALLRATDLAENIKGRIECVDCRLHGPNIVPNAVDDHEKVGNHSGYMYELTEKVSALERAIEKAEKAAIRLDARVCP